MLARRKTVEHSIAMSSAGTYCPSTVTSMNAKVFVLPLASNVMPLLTPRTSARANFRKPRSTRSLPEPKWMIEVRDRAGRVLLHQAPVLAARRLRRLCGPGRKHISTR
jgi:hypothetical protein